MTADHCAHWRGLVAMEVVGQLDPAERLALGAHLEGCPACRSERAGLLPLERALAAADPRRVEDSTLDRERAPEVPAHLGDAVRTRLRFEARRSQRGRRARAGLLSGVAAAVVAAAVVLGLQPWAGEPAGHTIAMTGGPGVHATVTLVPEAWGTRLVLRESGQAGGQVLTVSMRGPTGRWWDAGSYRTVAGRTEQVQLACAVPADEVYAVDVRDVQGRTVLHAEPA